MTYNHQIDGPNFNFHQGSLCYMLLWFEWMCRIRKKKGRSMWLNERLGVFRRLGRRFDQIHRREKIYSFSQWTLTFFTICGFRKPQICRHLRVWRFHIHPRGEKGSPISFTQDLIELSMHKNLFNLQQANFICKVLDKIGPDTNSLAPPHRSHHFSWDRFERILVQVPKLIKKIQCLYSQ